MRLRYSFIIILLLWCESLLAADYLSITVTGNFSESACEVNPSTSTVQVPLGSVGKDYFSVTGDTSPAVPFELELINCSSSTFSNVNVTFHGSDQDLDGILDIQTSGVPGQYAKGVGVKIFDSNHGDEELLLGNSSKPVPISDGVVHLRYKAAFVMTANTRDELEPGQAAAVATVDLVYK